MTCGLLDTSAVIDWHDPAVVAALPDEMAISATTAAELAAGPLLTTTPIEAAKRQVRLQEVESRLEPINSMGPPCAAMGSSSPPWCAKDENREVGSRTS